MTIHRAQQIAVLLLCGVSTSAFAAYGRTEGAFAVTPSGAALYSIPIWTPPGIHGVQPSLALVYDSQNASGMMGPGWSLDGLSRISRCNKTFAQDGVPAPITLTTSDAFCLDGKRLRTTGTGTYQSEIADFALITAVGTYGGGPSYFTVKRKNGFIYEYGNTTDSKRLPYVGSATPYAWGLDKITDRNGNSMTITYKPIGQAFVPIAINYAAPSAYQVSFTYSSVSGTDAISHYIAGNPLLEDQQLSKLTVTSSGTIVRQYNLTYTQSTSTARQTLTSIQECGGSAGTDCLPATTVGYQYGSAGIANTATSAASGVITGDQYGFDYNVDVDGDGQKDLITIKPEGSQYAVYVQFATINYLGIGYGTPIRVDAFDDLTPLLIDDFAADGGSRILISKGGSYYAYHWNGTSFDSVNLGIPTNYGAGSGPFLLYSSADVDGDGRPDIVSVRRDTGQLSVRINTTVNGVLSFAAPVVTSFPGGLPAPGYVQYMAGNNQWTASSISHFDFDGDGREDLIFRLSTTSTPVWRVLLSRGTGAFVSLASFQTAGNLNLTPLHWNDDDCTDLLLGNIIHISACNGSAATQLSIPTSNASGNLVVGIDWDGDGRTDVIAAVGGYWDLYKSLGNGVAPTVHTGIPVFGVSTPTSLTTYFVTDQDGDGLDDLLWIDRGTSDSIHFALHSGSGGGIVSKHPDLATAFTDGYLMSVKPSYGLNVGAQILGEQYYPYRTFNGGELFYPVRGATFTDPSNAASGTYYQGYSYGFAFENLQGRGFAAFDFIDWYDSRNQIETYDYYDPIFPYTGMHTTQQLTSATGAFFDISEVDNTEGVTVLDSTTSNQRYFPYFGTVTQYRWDIPPSTITASISKSVTNYTFDNSGNATNVVTTLTDTDSASPYYNEQWTSTTTNTIAPDTANWCLNLPTLTTVTRSDTSAGGGAITRTVSYPSPDYAKCRQNTQIIEPSGGIYKVTTAYGYDAFGNLNSSIVTGSGMTARSTGFNWGATGQFLTTVTNPLSQTTTFGHDPNSGMLTSAKDPNLLTTSWQYDNFNRKIRESRPDTTATTWAYNPCATAGCVNANNKMTVVQTVLNTNGTTQRIDNTYLDALDRTLVSSAELQTSAFNRVETQYDSLGNVHLQGAPCMFTSCTQYWTTNTYDMLNRLTQSQRPISSTNATLQSTIYNYQGRTLTVTDPQSKVTKTITHVTGDIGRTVDHNGYSVNTNRDSFGSVLSVTDSLSNTLWRATATAPYKYGIAAFLVSSTDMDLGSRSYTFDALGELAGYTDAKGQNFSTIYDALSRPTHRTEPDLTTTWTWGNTAASFNVGKLQSVSAVSSAGTYTDSYTYDNKGRLSNRSITVPIVGTLPFDYTYDATYGTLSLVKFPPSYPSTYRVTARYQFQNGILQAIRDGVTPTTFWWQSNSTNPAGQITQETTTDLSGDPQIVAKRTYDAVTGWVSSIQTGVTTGAALQNESYLYDLVGNVTQRQNGNAGLTENFYYDNLYRLDHSVLGSTTNLQMAYDGMGNITSRSDVAAGATWTYDPTHKHEVTQAGSSSFTYAYDANGNVKTRNGTGFSWTSYNYPSYVATSTESASFDYGPDRQRWRMIYDSAAGLETTYYATPAFEQVATSTGTEYRHYLYAAGRPVVVISRNTAGAVNARSLLTDHQGSLSAIVTDSSGASYAKESFTAYGNRRDATTWSGAPSSANRTTMDGVTREGYTFQTVLGSMGLNHMNGRVEDAVTGRFLSADPNVSNPKNTQSYNRYSYVNNNPLSFIDPSGFDLEELTVTGHTGGGAYDGGWGSIFSSRPGADFSYRSVNRYQRAGGSFRPAQRQVDNSKAVFASNNALDWNFFTTNGDLPTESALQGIDYLLTQLLSDLIDPQPTYINGVRVNTGIAPMPLSAGSVLDDLATFRSELGLAAATPGATTLARLDIGDSSFYGISGHGQDITFGINAVSATHAEADAFQQAINAGVTSRGATLYIDNLNGVCGYCANSGISSMMRASGVDSLTVVSPQAVRSFGP